MEKLEIIGVDRDNNTIICQSAAKTNFEIDIDEKLFSAIEGDLAHQQKLSRSNPSTMSPKLIQQKIRAGINLKTLAEQTNFPLKKLERYAYPIELEIEHIIKLAQASPLKFSDKRKSSSLKQILTDFFTQKEIPANSLRWKATKEPNQNWIISVLWDKQKLAFNLHNSGTNPYTTPLDNSEIVLNNSQLVDQKNSDPISTIIPKETTDFASIIPPEENLTLPMSLPEIKAKIDDTEENEANQPKKRSLKSKKPTIPTWDEVLMDIKSNEKKRNKN